MKCCDCDAEYQEHHGEQWCPTCRVYLSTRIELGHEPPPQCEAKLPGVGWQCERPPHSTWDHHEARRIEWYDVPTAEERAARAAEVTRQTFVIGYGWCEDCGRSVSTYDGTCTRCFAHVRAEG